MEDKKKLLHSQEIYITIVDIFHVYDACGKIAVTFEGISIITAMRNCITLVGIITLVGCFVTLLLHLPVREAQHRH